MRHALLQPYLFYPIPELSPDQVVKIQLKALRENDRLGEDSGIEGAYNFASPANREFTGPLERFARMVRNPLYSPMLNHKSARFEPVRIFGDQAEQRVTLIDANGQEAVYLFQLSRQFDNGYMGCWMTDGVIRE
jgi:hypothetical protein